VRYEPAYRAGDLMPNPKNWRRHPIAQQKALTGILREVGYAGAVLAYETHDGLVLVDGHLRASLDPDALIPVLVTDLTEDEADRVLLTLDPLAAMASSDTDVLGDLLESVRFDDSAINAMLEALANNERLPLPDPMAEWNNMPEYEQDDATSWKQLVVNFDNIEDLRSFANLVEQPVTEKTKSIWYPRMDKFGVIDRQVGGKKIDPSSNPEEFEIEVKNIRAIIRENTSDEFIVKEVMNGAYRKLQIQPTDVVLDIGLNIGIASIWSHTKGAKTIIGYEPDQDNFRLAERNIALNNMSDDITIFDKAVIGNDDATRNFSVNVHRNKGLHSLVSKKGRDSIEVECININTILNQYHPTVIKIDTEGAEYEILRGVDSFEGVRELILEFHHAHLNDIETHEKYNEILNLLRQHFTTVDARDSSLIGGAWTGIIYCNES
tara:strand:- start:259 stop:1566 length:1308 start_codon:yes stop_codon:yes gene_type:complete